MAAPRMLILRPGTSMSQHHPRGLGPAGAGCSGVLCGLRAAPLPLSQSSTRPPSPCCMPDEQQQLLHPIPCMQVYHILKFWLFVCSP